MHTELSLQQARCLHLAAQGLLHSPTKAATRRSLEQCITRMALLQIDTIHVVARSPYLVLFSRLGAYPQQWLDEALAKGRIFETWAHEASFAPIDDLALHRFFNRHQRSHWGLQGAQRLLAAQKEKIHALLAHIHQQGAVKSSDFERTDDRASAWWGWKDEKRWLEALFANGDLMVARREKFQRVYDVAQRVAPHLFDAGQELQLPDDAATARTRILEKSIAALGITQAKWVSDYYRTKPRTKDADLAQLLDSGRILRVEVQGWQAPAYVHQQHKALLKKACADQLQANHTALLSPFDPVVWDRQRASEFFDFDYRIECYTPEPKRQYGYFVLPILCHGELIGRLDAKAHRAEGVFEVKAIYTEKKYSEKKYSEKKQRWSDLQVASVAQAIAACAHWHGTPQVKISRSQPATLARQIRAALADA